MVPLALSILAIVLGVAGLYFGLTANSRLNPISESMEAGSSSAARIEKALAATETKMVELSSRVDDLKKALDRVRVYGSQNERAVKQMASAVKENREEMVKLAEGLNKLASGGVTRAATTASASTASSSDASSTATPAAVATDGTYKIQAGDNFGKIAKKLGVGLQELLDANPGKDPRRLTIGTVINVPTE